MPTPISKLSRMDPAIAATIRSWRRLTSPAGKSRVGPGEPTLIACSGGADSCALALALATATDRLIIAHVVHDLRPSAESLADRDVAKALAASLALPFVETHVQVRGQDRPRNLEAAARLVRYQALIEIARAHNLSYVALAHHADDQLETVLMSLLRGTGSTGIRGMSPRVKRRQPDGRHVSFIRPMLADPVVANRGVTREDCHRLCREAGVLWSEDATNQDDTRLRAALRLHVIPILYDLRPDAARRAESAARQSAAVEKLLRREARALLKAGTVSKDGNGWHWTRLELRKQPPIVLGALIRDARSTLRNPTGADAMCYQSLMGAAEAIRDECTDPRVLYLAGLDIHITSREVAITTAGTSGPA